MNTFEVRAFRDGRWTAESRCSSSDEAMAVANALAGDRKVNAVKVVEEARDQDHGPSPERTVFSYFKQGELSARGAEPEQAPSAAA